METFSAELLLTSTREGLSVCQRERDSLVHWTANHVLATRGIHAIKTECGKQKPSRHLAAVVVMIEATRYRVMLYSGDANADELNREADSFVAEHK